MDQEGDAGIKPLSRTGKTRVYAGERVFSETLQPKASACGVNDNTVDQEKDPSGKPLSRTGKTRACYW